MGRSTMAVLALVVSLPAGAADKKPERPVAEVSERGAPLIERIGASVELYGESSRMSGEQWINNFRADESFDYRAGPLAATVYALFHPTERFRVGPAVRFMGNYGERFTFGYLAEAHAQADYALRAFEQVDAVFGTRVGVSVLFPGEELAEEIRRLQAQRADVWSVPRLGWVAGLSVGARRKIAGNLYGRAEISGQLGHHFLFSTDQIVDGLRFRKFWGTDVRRLGFNLGVEVAL